MEIIIIITIIIITTTSYFRWNETRNYKIKKIRSILQFEADLIRLNVI
jgi:hypothetical protein